MGVWISCSVSLALCDIPGESNELSCVGNSGQADLYLDDKLIVSNSKNQQRGDIFFGSGTVEVKSSISLKAGQQYKIEMKWSNLRPVVEGGQYKRTVLSEWRLIISVTFFSGPHWTRRLQNRSW